MSETTRISIADATDLISDALMASGASEAQARPTAIALVSAEAEGQVGHGFSRLEDYAAQVRSGKINRDAEITVNALRPASILTNADCGFAYPAIDTAISELVPVAKEMGIAIAAVGNSHHCGALSLQVEKLANAGLIGLMFTNAPKAIAPWGSNQPLFGTNPIAFGVPRAKVNPLVIDLSLSKVARGKVMNAKKQGKPIPEGWALDADGHPTTDAEAALQGTMLPIGDAKGAALALMVEILAAPLTGSAFSYEAGSFFTADGVRPRVGQTLIAIRPNSDGTGFSDRLEELLTSITALDGARLPGTRRLAATAASKADGLNVSARYIEIARALASGLKT
ncbi:MAG: Ldh family oxidoreductase [Boseongicola sp.]|nr:Ldh family oxidoreductase [Boseongicola sp.]